MGKVSTPVTPCLPSLLSKRPDRRGQEEVERVTPPCEGRLTTIRDLRVDSGLVQTFLQ